MDNLRQTGRTIRMLEDAKRLAKEGRAVYIITQNRAEQKRLAHLLGNPDDNPYANPLGIKVETPDTPGNFDWETCSLIGAFPNCVVLIDHFAVECEISRRLAILAKAIQMMRQYDL